jgi:hypothetical protein
MTDAAQRVPGQEQPLPGRLGPRPAQRPRVLSHDLPGSDRGGVLRQVAAAGQALQRLADHEIPAADGELAVPEALRVRGVLLDPQQRGSEHPPGRGGDLAELGLRV